MGRGSGLGGTSQRGSTHVHGWSLDLRAVKRRAAQDPKIYLEVEESIGGGFESNMKIYKDRSAWLAWWLAVGRPLGQLSPVQRSSEAVGQVEN